MKLKAGDGVALVCCSDARNEDERSTIDAVASLLASFGLAVSVDYGMFDPARNTDAKIRADRLARFMENPDISAIFDVSGGNLSNGLLSYLDINCAAKTGKAFFCYSDLTTLANPLADAGVPIYLYQVRNLTGGKGSANIEPFRQLIFGESQTLTSFAVRFVRGGGMRGRAVGGNLRSLLKLAATPHWPDFKDCLLFLEALGGDAAFIETCFAQLGQTGALDAAAGVVLGTFTALENERYNPADIALRWMPKDKPLALTASLGHGAHGHGAHAHALMLGAVYSGTAKTGLSITP